MENPAATDRLEYVIVESGFGDPQRALDYLDQWLPGTVEVQYQYWPEDLLRAHILHRMGRTEDAKSFAATALVKIESAQTFEPNAPEIKKAEAFAMALLGRADEAETAAKRVREIYPSTRDDWGAADYLLNVIEVLAIAGRYELALEWLDDYLSGGGAQATLVAIREFPGFSALVQEPGFTALVEKHGLVPEEEHGQP